MSLTGSEMENLRISNAYQASKTKASIIVALLILTVVGMVEILIEVKSAITTSTNKTFLEVQ